MKYLVSLLMIVVSTLSAEYNIGDTVENFSFDEIIYYESGSYDMNRTDLYEVLEEGKPLLIYFFDISYS